MVAVGRLGHRERVHVAPDRDDRTGAVAAHSRHDAGRPRPQRLDELRGHTAAQRAFTSRPELLVARKSTGVAQVADRLPETHIVNNSGELGDDESRSLDLQESELGPGVEATAELRNFRHASPVRVEPENVKRNCRQY
nr:hypothetical protein DA06_16095 [Georgenia sp. SUBG003]